MDLNITKSVEQGFVSLRNIMGNDLMVVNVARVSYSRYTNSWTPEDARLLRYLYKHQHTSPFRHPQLHFHIKMPIFVARQWMKHVVGCSWNEQSARYTKLTDDFWLPDVMHTTDVSQKQGSNIVATTEGTFAGRTALTRAYDAAYDVYESMLSMGFSREEARAVLPMGVYTEVYWTCSLQALLHFFNLRLDLHAQYTTRLYAKAVYDVVSSSEAFTETLALWRRDFSKTSPESHIEAFGEDQYNVDSKSKD